jgi:hypothetical protein
VPPTDSRTARPATAVDRSIVPIIDRFLSDGGGGPTALNIAYSTNDSSYSNVVVVQQNYQFPGSQNIYASGMLNMAANSYVQVYFYNNSGATVGFTNTATYSTIQIARVA